MVRAILGVIVGFIIAFVISAGLFFGTWFALGVDGVLQKGVFAGNMTLNIAAPLASILGGLAGGLLCAKISRSPKAVVVLAALALVVIGLGSAMDQQRPSPGPRPDGLTVPQAIAQGKPPLWFSITNPIITAGGMLFGGRCCGACKKKA